MLAVRNRSTPMPLTKKPPPAQTTTGVASAQRVHLDCRNTGAQTKDGVETADEHEGSKDQRHGRFQAQSPGFAFASLPPHELVFGGLGRDAFHTIARVLNGSLEGIEGHHSGDEVYSGLLRGEVHPSRLDA